MNTTIDTWDPRQYDKFQREREQPFYDLLALVNRSPGMRVVDLGCGTGKLTRVLHDRLEARETIGVDRSEKMLEPTRADTLPHGLRFEVGTIESFAERAERGAARADLIFSNAAYHWVDDHDALLRRLAAGLGRAVSSRFRCPRNTKTPPTSRQTTWPRLSRFAAPSANGAEFTRCSRRSVTHEFFTAAGSAIRMCA